MVIMQGIVKTYQFEMDEEITRLFLVANVILCYYRKLYYF